MSGSLFIALYTKLNCDIIKMIEQIGEKLLTSLFIEIFKSNYKGIKSFLSLNRIKRKDFFYKAAKNYSDKLYNLYGKVKILGTNKSFQLRAIYVNLNIFGSPSSYKRVPIDQLKLKLTYDNRFKIILKTIKPDEIINEHHRILVLGKPGAGKTTLLKHFLIKTLENQRFIVNLNATVDCGVTDPGKLT